MYSEHLSIEELILTSKILASMSYTFKDIKLLKHQTIGTGAYGAVCKANCDDLVCAAKLIYPVLFSLSGQSLPELDEGREHRLPLRRFHQECQFLSQIRHPNIVQYLGTYRDPESGAPALLMELMDENLTSYLERQEALLPMHVQVNLLHDVALALAYLHSHGIIHRDLSSNNVLLIGSSRAKVTDFGMSSLVDMASPSKATLTTCPGTQVYMPPEALNEPPVYSEKLDCFSFGVLMLQVLTRQFPDPSNRFRLIEVCQPGNSSVKFQASVPVSELERRSNHIRQVKMNTLLPTALDCMNDTCINRPPSSDLCQRLAMIKGNDPSYHKSVQGSANLQKLFTTTRQQLLEKERELQSVISDKDSEIEELNTRLQKVEQLNKTLTEEKRQQSLRSLLEPRQREGSTLTADNSHSKLNNITWTKGTPAPIKMEGGTATQDGEVAFFAPQGSQNVYQFDPHKDKWIKLAPCPHSNATIVVIKRKLTAIGGHSFKTGISNKLYSYDRERWLEAFPPMPTRRFAVAAVSDDRVLVVAGGFGQGEKKLATVELMDIEARQWHCLSPLRFGFTEASAVMVGGRVYVGGGYSNKVEEYRVMAASLQALSRSSESVWKFTAALPVNRATLVSAGGRLLAFGGRQVCSYDEVKDNWEQESSFMETRVNPLVAALPKHLVVVGGNGCNRGVEVGAITDSTDNCSLM